MTTMMPSKLKKLLASMGRSELENLVLELYTLPAVKDAVNLKLNPEYTEEVVNRYEKKLGKVLMPANPERMSIPAAKEILSEVKGVSGIFPRVTAEVYLYAAECACDFTETFGDIDESFYNSLSDFYQTAADIAKADDKLKDELWDRFHALNESFYSMGWGMDEAADPEFD